MWAGHFLKINSFTLFGSGSKVPGNIEPVILKCERCPSWVSISERVSENDTMVFQLWHTRVTPQATFKRYQMEHKMKQESVERSQSDLKKLRRKSQGKNANKYENKESEVRWTRANTHTHTHSLIFLSFWGCYIDFHLFFTAFYSFSITNTCPTQTLNST